MLNSSNKMVNCIDYLQAFLLLLLIFIFIQKTHIEQLLMIRTRTRLLHAGQILSFLPLESDTDVTVHTSGQGKLAIFLVLAGNYFLGSEQIYFWSTCSVQN